MPNEPTSNAPSMPTARNTLAEFWRRFLAAVEDYQRGLDRAFFDDEARRRIAPIPVERFPRRSHRR